MKISIYYILHLLFPSRYFLVKARRQFASGSDENRDRVPEGSLFQRIIIISTTWPVTHLLQRDIEDQLRKRIMVKRDRFWLLGGDPHYKMIPVLFAAGASPSAVFVKEETWPLWR